MKDCVAQEDDQRKILKLKSYGSSIYDIDKLVKFRSITHKEKFKQSAAYERQSFYFSQEIKINENEDENIKKNSNQLK